MKTQHALLLLLPLTAPLSATGCQLPADDDMSVADGAPAGDADDGPAAGSDGSSMEDSGPPPGDDDDDHDDDDDDDGDDDGPPAGDDDDDDDDDDDAGTGGEDDGSGDDDGGSSGEPDEVLPPPDLLQAAYNPASGDYEYGHDSIPSIPITEAPQDVDWTRWAMLHDGSTYRLYFMAEGADDLLYQFGFDPATQVYRFGHDSIPAIPIEGAPVDADLSRIAMLHDGTTYRLYARTFAGDAVVQFGYDPGEMAYVFGHDSIPRIDITGTPAQADWDGWAMLHDGAAYRLYAFDDLAHDGIVQHAFNPTTGDYQYGYDSIPQLDVDGFPTATDRDDFAMLHDGAAFRFYFLSEHQSEQE